MADTLFYPHIEPNGRRVFRFDSSQSRGRASRRGTGGRHPPLHESGHPKLSDKGREGGSFRLLEHVRPHTFFVACREHANLAESASAFLRIYVLFFRHHAPELYLCVAAAVEEDSETSFAARMASALPPESRHRWGKVDRSET